MNLKLAESFGISIPMMKAHHKLKRTASYVLCAAILFTMVHCTSDNPSTEPAIYRESDNPIAMIIKQRSDTASVLISSQLLQAFEYAKISARTYETDLIAPDTDFTIPSSVRLLCLTVSDVQTFSDSQMQKIVEFVAAGNTLFVTAPVYDERLNYLTGIKKNASYSLSDQAKGLYFKQHVFPNYANRGFKLRASFQHDGFSEAMFKDQTNIIARSYSKEKAPVIVEHLVGQGQTILFNSGVAYDKLYRGLLFSLILPSLEGIPYPVANVSTIFLDDFPLPLYDQKKAPIDWEYDVTEERFITNIWWPDMRALADSFNIDYTAILAFNYNANVVPPFDFGEWNASDVSIPGEATTGSAGLAQSVKKSRHELGFHGYNHFSLWMNDWPNQQFMVSALQAALKRWRIDDLGPLPVSYVPPTNEIDSVGIEALTRAMPNIKYLSSLYLGDIEDGGGREFGPDPYQSELFNYPRVTSGFTMDEENIFNLQSLYLLTGIWTHFVHPDDVFQIKQRNQDYFISRNEQGLGWHSSRDRDYGLFEVFNAHLDTITNTYPLNRFRTVKKAVPEVKNWKNMRLRRGRSDSLFYTSKVNNKDQQSAWFVYVDSSRTDSIEQYLDRQSTGYHKTPLWNGYLVQFKSQADSLVFPNFRAKKEAGEGIKQQVRTDYLAYISESEESGSTSLEWTDTRLEDARRALERNPSSDQLQKQVIDLAVEFQQVPLAIEVLEDRLLNNEQWASRDIDRLLKYYGWEQNYDRAFNFLEELWNRYGDNSVITMKEMMVDRYGAPDAEFRTTWLKRELALNPNDKHVLERLITSNQSQENWPQTKEYLHQLIEQNPASDSLYHYTLQRSFYYDEPQETLTLLESFPEGIQYQLQPLASQITNLYAYTDENYTKALQWAARAEDYPAQPQLEWLLQQKRYKAFIERSDSLLNRRPKDDSLRTFIGQQLIYGGFYDEGYAQLYPLFKANNAQETTRNLVHTEIGYQPYSKKKSFYRKYPAFFSDSLEQNLQQQYRQQEGMKVGLTGDYASDNFDNTIGRAGVFAEWGNRQKYTHRLTGEQTFVGSNVNSGVQNDQLSHLQYQYKHLWPNEGWQLTTEGGVYLNSNSLRPEGSIAAGYGVDSTYTSVEATFQPEFTETALERDINKFSLALFREDNWRNGALQTSLSLEATRYSNEVFAGESVGRLYVLLPFSTRHNQLRNIAELSYSDASEIFEDGVPYFTPDNLFIQGIGAEYRYRDLIQNPDLSLRLELMGKHDSENGFYLTSSASLNAQIRNYWNISLDANISSSAVYRYNRVGLTVSYIFPKEL